MDVAPEARCREIEKIFTVDPPAPVSIEDRHNPSCHRLVKLKGVKRLWLITTLTKT